MLFLLSVGQVSAHAEGLTPFLKINNEYPEINPVNKEAVVPASFSIPEDSAKGTYLINEPIKFSIDTAVLTQIYSEDVLTNLVYEWELGDGSVAQGTDVKHTYKKAGSMVLTIYVDFNDPEVEFARQPIETVQINVLPNKEYTIAQPVISVNRRELAARSEEVNMQNSITFEASVKNQPTAEIVSYAWDFGEGGRSTEQKAVHTYTTDPSIVTPILKVTDKNGFISYAYGMLTNGKSTEGYTFATNTVGTVILGIQAIVVVIGIIWFAIVVRKKKKM